MPPMLDEQLLKILVCPETRQPLSLADNDLLEKLNNRIRQSKVKNIGNQAVDRDFEAALITEDGARLYPVYDGIPVLLREAAVLVQENELT